MKIVPPGVGPAGSAAAAEGSTLGPSAGFRALQRRYRSPANVRPSIAYQRESWLNRSRNPVKLGSLAVSPPAKNSFLVRWSEKRRSELDSRRKKRLSQSAKLHPMNSRFRLRSCEN